MSSFLRLGIALAWAVFLSQQVQAQFFLNGNARAVANNCYELTTTANWQVGSIWNADKLDLRENFDLVMEVFLGCSDLNGADGIVFGLQPVSTSIGSGGGSIGFGGVVPSIGIEMDTYQNLDLFDPVFDHLAITRNGNLNHSSINNLAGPVRARASSDNAETCDYFDLRISWNATTQTLDVYFDCALRLTYQGDIINQVFNGDPFVFWGFTSATGGLSNIHRVCFSYTTLLDQLQDVVVCPGGQIRLGAVGGQTYEWSPAAGLSDPNIPNPIASPDTTTTYQLRITDQCNRVYFDDVTVTVAGSPVFLDLGPDTILCSGQSLPLNVSTPAATYQWSNGTSLPTLNVSSPGTYAVTVTRTDTACIAEDMVEVGYRPLPGVYLGRDTVLCLGQQILLQAVFPEAITTWQNGLQDDTLIVTEAGRYVATLSHPCGTISDDVRVDFEDCHQLYLPNAFSPNDDGVNDYFYPQEDGDVATIVRFQVFDRWGGLVFDRSPLPPNVPASGWDGSARGKPTLAGVYTWVLEVVFRDGYSERRSGSVTLLR